MLYLLFTSIILIPTLAGWGSISEKYLGNLFPGISSKIMMGIFTLSILWTVIALFFPLHLLIEIASILIGLFFFFKERLYLKFNLIEKENVLYFFSIVVVILLFGSFYPFILDHFGYYVPTINFLSEFGLVKGISNLDLILGQMSIWHIFQTGFSHFSDPFLRINIVVMITYLMYVFERKSFLHLLFFPILFLFVQSPSTDLPVIVFSLIILNEMLNQNQNIHLIFAISIIVFAIKPTNMWLPLLAFLYGLFYLKSKPKFLLGGGFILLLFFFKNLWTFGYPIFPVQLLDLGLSWKPNPEILQNSAELAIEKTYDLQYSYHEIQSFSVVDAIRHWLFLDGIKSKIHILWLLCLGGFVVFSIIRNKKIYWFICISLLIKSVLVLMFSAQYRFFIDVFFVIFFVVLYSIKNARIYAGLFVLQSILLGIALAFPQYLQQQIPSFRLGFFMKGFDYNQLYKPAHYQLEQYKTYQIGNLKFNVSEAYPFIFDTPPPSISPSFLREYEKAKIFPQLNTSNIKDGFHWQKLSTKDQESLKKIIAEIDSEVSTK